MQNRKFEFLENQKARQIHNSSTGSGIFAFLVHSKGLPSNPVFQYHFQQISVWKLHFSPFIFPLAPVFLYSFPVCICPLHHVPLPLKTASIPNVRSASPYTAFSTNYSSTHISPKNFFMPMICISLKLPPRSTKL